MSFQLPPIVTDYLAASDRKDVDAVVACFTDDALVIDEDQEWRGHAGIRRWRETVAAAFEYTVEVLGAVALGAVEGLDRTDVETRLEGNFPGGTVDLTFRFALRGALIASLVIVPAETVAPPPS
jgi:hypothetical protein